MPNDDRDAATDGRPPTAVPSGEAPAPGPTERSTDLTDLRPEPDRPGTPTGDAMPRAGADSLDQTVGTGSVFAIGCVALTVLILALGVGYAVITRLL